MSYYVWNPTAEETYEIPSEYVVELPPSPEHPQGAYRIKPCAAAGPKYGDGKTVVPQGPDEAGGRQILRRGLALSGIEPWRGRRPGHE